MHHGQETKQTLNIKKKKNHLSARNILDLTAHGLNISKQLLSSPDASLIWRAHEAVTTFHPNHPLHQALRPFSDSPYHVNCSPSVKGVFCLHTTLGFSKTRK